MSRVRVVNIGTLYTMAGTREPVVRAELEIVGGNVAYAGPERKASNRMPRSFNPYPLPPVVTQIAPDDIIIDAQGALVSPGLVDPHTHAVYGGSRAFELPLKLAGVPYLEILARGGGILATVEATRNATDDELFDSAKVRLETMARHGVTTVEVKTGYGLSLAEELRLLQIIQRLDADLPMSLVATFMGAHAVPPEFKGRADEFVDLVVSSMLPAVAEQGIARFVDVFCEAGVFTIEQSRHILVAAKELGFNVKIHADEIVSGTESLSGAQLAAELGATSADHLRETDEPGFAALAGAGVIPVVLPATSFCLRDHRYADARTMIDGFGLPVALATDCNPGTSPTESLQLVMAIAALELRMTPEEILAGVTVNAARAVGMEDKVGSLAPGNLGDAVIWQAYDLNMLPYRFGVNQVTTVIKAGVII